MCSSNLGYKQGALLNNRGKIRTYKRHSYFHKRHHRSALCYFISFIWSGLEGKSLLSVRSLVSPYVCLHRLCIQIPPTTRKTSDRGASAMPQENVEETVERREGMKRNILLQNRAAQGGREEIHWSFPPNKHALISRKFVSYTKAKAI